jgi:AbrB family looped-hinge helix DNA binding protein
MSTFVKVQPKGQMTIPRRVRSAVGLIDGDLVEVRAVGKKIVITPQLVIDRSRFLDADNEYTPAQRRVIDAQLDEAAKRPFHGPFNTADEMIAHMKGELKKRAAANKSKRSR